MRKKRLLYNTISSLTFQFTTIICGFILPRLILHAFGSEVNGLVNSIIQFLSVISFLELGVGAVVQSSLYKPLSDKNYEEVSKIIKSASRFFKRLAQILLVYIILLMIFYPYFAKQNFSWIYSATLIVAISISFFAQYYFGVVDRLLLNADQHGYIQYNAQTITVILNTIACVVLIKIGCSIHIVKLTTSLIYLLRPIFLREYVNRHYKINRQISYDVEPIKQKWNGIAQHVAAVILDGTDSIVLTIFSTLTNVSIYSIYFLVVNGVKQLLISLTGGIQSLMGELWAKKDLEHLREIFSWCEWGLHSGTIFVFGCTSILIVPFIQIYTNGITDANYIQPVFGLLLVWANALHCLRLPYNLMILAGGHYRQTQMNYIISALLNVSISILAVKGFGLIGVAIGTLVAMTYQTVWMAIYNSKNLLKWPFINFCKQLFVDILTVILSFLICNNFSLNSISYMSWIIMALKVALCWGAVALIMNIIFYKDKVIITTKKIRKLTI